MSKRYFQASKAKPGVISDELRRALGIHKDKLPIWIYRMRVLGYPPGWLQEAQVSTLQMIDGNNDSKEEGEVGGGGTGTDGPVQYNKDSLIEYPGFNIPVPEGVSDDWYYLRMPPLLEQQQLKEALKTMKVTQPVPYKRTKQEWTPTPSPSTSLSKRKSMDETSNERSKRHSCSRSESLSESQTNGFSAESPLSPSKSDQNISENENVFNESTDESKTDEFKTPLKPTDKLNDSKEDSSRKLKLISMGSPMPASERPKRPSLEKWSEGMGELLYFENPNPEYTGVYENKMKKLIEKIRKKNS